MVEMKPPDEVEVAVAMIRSDPLSWMLRLQAVMVASNGTAAVVAAAFVAVGKASPATRTTRAMNFFTCFPIPLNAGSGFGRNSACEYAYGRFGVEGCR